MKKNRRKRGLLLLFLLLSLFLCACGKKDRDAGSSDRGLKDGSYPVYVSLSGGTGKASLTSPAELTVSGGKMTARIEWSSKYYDYMIVDGEKYLPIKEAENSTFDIPVAALDQPFDVIADTTAMSTPHEITYSLTFSLAPMEERLEEKETTRVDTETFAYEKGSKISASLLYERSMELSEARGFRVDYYYPEGNGKKEYEDQAYALIQILGDQTFLLLPEGKDAPEDLPADIMPLKKPLDQVYLVASAIMDMYRSIDALDQIRFSGLKEDGWFLPEVAQKMKDGHILYAGKYSAPDYEKILAEGCNLAIENTMIYHTPEVKEQLEHFDIPVLVDYSSYETEPLARMEWVKLYGLLAGKSQQALEVYEKQAKAFASIGEKKEGASVAFFYLTSDGQVNVRRADDYLPKMIALAGGSYIFDHIGEEEDSNSSTLSLQMEEFYATAKDADYFIYNSTTVEELKSIEELVAKNSLLSKCKAVQDKKVFCTSKNLYQSSMELGTIVGDIQKMLEGEYDRMTYLYPLK